MKRLTSSVTEEYELEVVECDCGYHMGMDATYLLQVEDFITICPSCQTEIKTAEVCSEELGKTDA
jgi:hypothetical protein